MQMRIICGETRDADMTPDTICRLTAFALRMKLC
jgi:hypothetical protein